jgi:hypothetical protein
MIDEPEPRTFREMVRVLRDFEGRRCIRRVATAAVAYCAIRLLPLVGAVAAIYIGANLQLEHVVLGAAISLGSASLAVLLSRRTPWRTALRKRLSTYEQPNPRTFVELLIRDDDFAGAYRALRRASFSPLYGASVGRPPDDATDLTARIGIEEPEAWMRSISDDDRLCRIASVLAAAGIRARVATVDAFPGGRIERRHTDDAGLVGSGPR